MQIAMISECGEGAGILYKLADQGNNVKLYINNPAYKNGWRGLLPKVSKINQCISGADLVLFDTIGFGKLADKLKSEGFNVYGASSFADKLEEDRDFGIEFMEIWGINFPRSWKFINIKDAITFVKDNKNKYVFKPSGSHNDVSCSLTYVANDAIDMIGYLEFVNGLNLSEFILQEFIEGVAISTEVIVKNGKSIGIYDHTIENKKFMNGNIGPSTGCEGNIVWLDFYKDDIAIKNGIGKVKDFNSFTGLIDLNCIVSEDKVYGLEWTPRFGYDATPVLLYKLFKGELIKFFTFDFDELSFIDELASSVRFSIPPYPLEGLSPDYNNTGVPLRINNFNYNDYYFYEIMTQENKIVHSGGIGNIGLGLGLDYSPEESFKKALNNVKKIILPDKQYRTDLGNVISDNFDNYLNRRNVYA